MQTKNCCDDARQRDSVIVCVTTFREYILQNVITSEMEIMHDRPEVTLSINFKSVFVSSSGQAGYSKINSSDGKTQSANAILQLYFAFLGPGIVCRGLILLLTFFNTTLFRFLGAWCCMSGLDIVALTFLQIYFALLGTGIVCRGLILLL